MNQERIRNSIAGKVASVAIGMTMMAAGFTPVMAANNEVPVTSVSFPSNASVKVGEAKTLNVTIKPSNTTYKTNIEWGSQTNGYFAYKTNGYGTYWNQASSSTITGKSAGNGYLFTTVKVYNSKGKYIKKYEFGTTVKVSKQSATSTSHSKKSNKYLSVSKAYTELNKFRTTKNVWQWNVGSKSKTYFNTNSNNTLKKLKRDKSLEKTAKVRAKEIAKRYSHTRPNGTKCFTAFPKKFMHKGENIAYGHESAASVTNAWKETNCKYGKQGHRRNMLNKNYTSVGIACYQKDGTKYWVQCFGK